MEKSTKVFAKRDAGGVYAVIFAITALPYIAGFVKKLHM